MPIPFSATATLNLPGGPSLPNDPIAAVISANFENQTEYRLNLTGAGTHTVGMGTVAAPGVKCLLVMVEASNTAAPVILRTNGAVAGGEEISPGGFLLLGSPAPVSGITSVSLLYTTAVTVRIWALS